MEQPDIMLDENVDEPEVEEPAEPMETDENPPSSAGGNFFTCVLNFQIFICSTDTAKLKTRITFEEYNKICYMITHHIRREEEAADGGCYCLKFIINWILFIHL